MSLSYWKRSLETTLATARARNNTLRVAVVGVGNSLKGDDAAGVLAARLLRKRLLKQHAGPGGAALTGASYFISDGCLVVEAGLAPENFTGVLRRFQPGLILVIDAVWMGDNEAAGFVVVLPIDQAEGFGASTHLQPLATLGGFLRHELDCAVWLVGIQPARLDFGSPVSPPVRRVCSQLAAWLAWKCESLDGFDIKG
jgi:hydrogenase 3 maturation protease